MRDLSQSLFTPPALVFLLRLFLPAALTYGLQFVALLRGTFMLRAPLPVTLINSFVPMRRVHRVVRHVVQLWKARGEATCTGKHYRLT